MSKPIYHIKPSLQGTSGTSELPSPPSVTTIQTLRELHAAAAQVSFQPGNRFDPANLPPAREYFGYLSTPTTAPPAGGYRVMGTGPIVHNAIVGAGYGSSNWEEDGERAFSVRRAVD